MNSLKHCPARKFPQGKSPQQDLRITTDGKKEGSNIRPNQRWKFGINTLDKIPLCKLWENHWQQQQEGARPGEADLGKFLEKAPTKANCEKGGILHKCHPMLGGNSTHALWITRTWTVEKWYLLHKNTGTPTSKQTRKVHQDITEFHVESLLSLSLTLSLSPALFYPSLLDIYCLHLNSGRDNSITRS